MDLIFLINALLRKKWVIVICVLAGIGAGLLISYTKKKLYLSAAQYSTGFTIRQQVRLGSDNGSGFTETEQRFKNVIETFKSTVVIAMVSYNLMLHDLAAAGDSTQFKRLNEKQLKTAEYAAAMANVGKMKQLLLEKKATRTILKAYYPEEKKVWDFIKLYGYDNESILNNLVVDRVAGTDYLNILFRSENPEMSAYVVNTIGDEFIRFYNSLSVTRTEESASKLDSLARRKKEEIDSLNESLQKFKAGFGTPDVTDNAKGSLDIVREGFTKQADISGELNKLRADLLSVNTQLEIYKGVNVSSNAATNNNAEYIGLINRNRELAGEMARKPGGFDADLNEQILANQRKMQQLAATAKPPSTEAAETRRKREELTNRKIALENQIIAQEQTLASIGITIKTYENKGRQGAGADIKVAAMQAQIDMANKQYEVMLTRLQGAQDVNLAPDINFKQTLLGQPAIKPESANRKASILLSTLSALLLSSLSIIILDFTDKSLRAPSIFTRSVNIKLLTTLPQISLTNTIVSSFFSKNTEDGRSDNATKLADSMRKLRYEIEASGKRIILVTSTKTKEGKSTIIEALANSFGQTKKRVLLVDANFSNNSLTQRYDAKATLEKISAKDERDFGAQLVDASSKTDIINCNIIGCDSADYSPAEILPKNSLLEYLPVVLTAYDFVLIEAANLNEHADAKELARYADGIVVVFSARSVIKPQDEESIQFLQTQKDKLIGAVLNNIDKENLAL